MKNKGIRNPERKDTKKNSPITDKQDIQNSSDQHIDQDFSGYPHAPAKEEIIKPQTNEQNKTASVNIKDGEKMMGSKNKMQGSEKIHIDESEDGSGNAFEQTEQGTDDA